LKRCDNFLTHFIETHDLIRRKIGLFCMANFNVSSSEFSRSSSPSDSFKILQANRSGRFQFATPQNDLRCMFRIHEWGHPGKFPNSRTLGFVRGNNPLFTCLTHQQHFTYSPGPFPKYIIWTQGNNVTEKKIRKDTHTSCTVNKCTLHPKQNARHFMRAL
jgi:hypothetical protein